jgi:hypothetical protein
MSNELNVALFSMQFQDNSNKKKNLNFVYCTRTMINTLIIFLTQYFQGKKMI